MLLKKALTPNRLSRPVGASSDLTSPFGDVPTGRTLEAKSPFGDLASPIPPQYGYRGSPLGPYAIGRG